ncbi:MAG: TIGR03619 family F420-dependent LLM class oxidoreductase [Gammaproteobacteria bacterium]
MKIGLVAQITEPESMPGLARAVEALGFESLFMGEHTHMPVDTVHAYTGDSGQRSKGYVPDYYRRFPDPYACLAAAAVATSRLRLGTCVALPAEHPPLALAKTVATLDRLGAGRLVFGVGYGWNRLELENNGIDFAARHAVLREKILAMRELWSRETATFAGEHVRFSECWSYPKPAQARIPVLLGAKLTPRAIRHIVEFCDGCIPVKTFEDGRLAEDLAALRDAMRQAGRDPATLDVTIVEPSGSMAGKRSAQRFDEVLPAPEWLGALERLGVTRVLLGLPLSSPELTAHAMARYAQHLGDRLTPQARAG